VRQYGRRYRLEVGNGTQSIVIDNLAISFNIEKTISEEPNTSKIEIYNLNADNRNQIANKIFNQVKLFAGYDDPRLIFAGQITQAYTIRDDLDFITHIESGDGQADYSRGRVYTTLKAGVKDSDVVNICVKAMGSSKQGVIDLPRDKALPRCKVLSGDIKEYLKHVAKNNDANWHILDGNLNILPKNKVLNNSEGFILSEQTGLIGSPEKTDDGLKITCLLNPVLNIGGLIRVKSILSEYDGDYKITQLTHNGDFLNDTWQTELIAINGKFHKVKKK
jgi:hypothetical protein